MELLVLLSNRDEIITAEVKKVLKRYTVYPLKAVEEFEDLQRNLPVNLLLIDTVSQKLSRIETLLDKLEDDMVVLITPREPDKFTLKNLPPSVYDCVDSQSLSTGLDSIVDRAIERRRFKNELNQLKKTIQGSVSARAEIYGKPAGEAGTGRDGLSRHDRYAHESSGGRYKEDKVIVNFARMLTASFDMRKLFSHFIDSVMEIVRVSRISILLRDEKGFYVKTEYGLYPYIADNLRIEKDTALVSRLSKTGRIMNRPVSPVDTDEITIQSDMDLLQCAYSFPMMHKGKLIGIFNIDNKITGEPFYREELEVIYVLCNYLAAAVKNIDIYNQMWYQEEFTKNVLSSMNSGMIAIDKDEKISVFNQKASEILNLNSSEIAGSDLRSLPSPLGDILYETMVAGTSYKRYEVEVYSGRISLGINSYRLMDEQQRPVGAGIVFTDLSDSKKLEEQKRRAERLEAVNDLIVKIAHEVRTPLTSIQTYTQLLNEKYGGDEELQNFFTATVIQSIHKLDSLIDKLAIFSSKPDYSFSKEDVNLIIHEAADYTSKNISSEYKVFTQDMENPVFVNADKKLLMKAFYYLVLSIIDRASDEKIITISARTTIKTLRSVEILITYRGKEFTDKEKQQLLKPLADIHNLGTEFNVPVCHKIIEKHNGSLDIKSENGNNIFIIRLPVIDRRGAAASVEDKRVDG